MASPEKTPSGLPTMAGWFEPGLLIKLLWRVVVSELFGQYADRRLIVAALDPVSADELVKRAKQFMPGGDNAEVWDFAPKDGAVWIDYVADLGDGFDSTYAMACLLARDELTFGQEKLPRGQLLVMGGDEVYPNASAEAYRDRLRTPYEWAYPDSNPKLLKGPPVYVLPGNHDWYDGLVQFLALFCRREHLHLGGWRSHQRRSYFALQLTETWWIWGMDSQLDDDMDQPQKDYFVAIAKGMPENSNIILCGPEPGWLYTNVPGGASLKIMDYLAWIAINHCKGVRIPLVISGDTHHYSRYEGDDGMTQFVTSGGGGAFLHPTHQLAPTIDLNRRADGIVWMKSAVKKLTLGAFKDAAGATKEACYPDRATSLDMLRGNFKFASLNRGFGIVLGVVYFLLGLIVRYLPCDVWYIAPIVLAAGFYAYTKRTEGASAKVGWVSATNGIAHSLTLIACAWVFNHFNAFFVDSSSWPRLTFLLFGTEMIGAGGVVAAELFGAYLYVSSAYLDMNHNDAFSSMRRDTHRNFIRMKIVGEELTLYPIGLTKIPARDAWAKNPTNVGPIYVTNPDLNPELIEPAVTIKAQRKPNPPIPANDPTA
ncbi:metallophosphoesterase [Bradyrhizobium quebecense]|uniref:Metallophosphoesterase n=1 Tax=Bradyrhizobium quebecense TaxID=2748629 RepID=A0A974ACS2_9BRAD|nr:metallophosphoesterase [Bradyrhizobium quebecense]UGA47782.1 metallophosphoesterase [Bradyrhizobium quebecense]